MVHSELLAPAGEPAALAPLLDAGADAIYVGLSGFSSRPQSSDLSLEEIEKAAALCHARGARLHIALNGGVPEEKLDALYNSVSALDEMGVDALIAADWGVLARLSKQLRHAELHASTLLGTYNSRTIRYLQKLGVRRTVLSTNLYFDEMDAILQTVPDMEFEIVADGGICFNDNRICELPHVNEGGAYTVYCQQDYTLFRNGREQSPKRSIGARHISSWEIVDAYLELGIFSFKIEGRTVPYPYILPRVRKLRQALDAYETRSGRETSVLHYLCRRSGHAREAAVK